MTVLQRLGQGLQRGRQANHQSLHIALSAFIPSDQISQIATYCMDMRHYRTRRSKCHKKDGLTWTDNHAIQTIAVVVLLASLHLTF